jgi:hypothetical protein
VCIKAEAAYIVIAVIVVFYWLVVCEDDGFF